MRNVETGETGVAGSGIKTPIGEVEVGLHHERPWEANTDTRSIC